MQNALVEDAFEIGDIFFQLSALVGHNHSPKIRTLFEDIRKTYQHINFSLVAGPVILVLNLNDELPKDDVGAELILELPLLVAKIGPSSVIQWHPSRASAYLWSVDQIDLHVLSANRLVYYRDQQSEKLAVNGTILPIKLSKSGISHFDSHSFVSLNSALQHYYNSLARLATCYLLRSAWTSDQRLLFVAKPEHIMRDSLTNFLRSHFMGDVEVRPEQNVDERHPIDIKVSWSTDSRHALLEIKWLGDSVGGTNYRDQRARDGAKQLADYLDQDKQSAPNRINRGYLVIFDGRRKGLANGQATISKENGMNYQHKEIEFDPNYHLVRGDFAPPVRMFLEPICT